LIYYDDHPEHEMII